MRFRYLKMFSVCGLALAAAIGFINSADAQVGYYYPAPAYYVAPAPAPAPVTYYYNPAPVYVASPPPVVAPVVNTPAYHFYQPAPVATYYRARVTPRRAVYKYYTPSGVYRYRYRY